MAASSINSVPRYGFQDAMKLLRLQNLADDTEDGAKFMSVTPAWLPGGTIPWEHPDVPKVFRSLKHSSAFGAHVYIQAPLAAATVVAAEDEKTNTPVKRRFGIHSIQGVFTNPGYTDRPFIYDVSKVQAGRSFATYLTKASQPTHPSAKPSGPFIESDASISLGENCFTCLTTFKRPQQSPADEQVESAQDRYADILSSRAPEEWEPSPPADFDMITEMFPCADQADFPILDLYKVDMTGYNASKPVSERRQLVLYRLHKPIPQDDANAHVLCHAFEADRNGFCMLGNELGYGYNIGKVASLSYSFYVHCNADEAVLSGDGWWIQEVYWPRTNAGRGMMESRIWSPKGIHVASGYQDGICVPARNVTEATKL